MKKLLIPLILLAMSGCGGGQVETPDLPQRVLPGELESQCNQLYAKNENGKRLSWKGHVPVLFSFDPSFPEEFQPAVKAAMDEWNKAAGFELFRLAPSLRASSTPAADGQNTFYFLNNDNQGRSLRGSLKSVFVQDGDVALTIVTGFANRIMDADIIFDGVANKFTTSSLHLLSFDVEATALHELGHSIGLAHSPDSSSTMYFEESPAGFGHKTLDATTVKMLECEYK